MQKYLHDEGYRTGLAGKLLQGIDETADPPYWDEWATSLWGYYNANFNVDGGSARSSHTRSISRAARKTVPPSCEENDDRPWFLYLAPVAPHLPYEPADRHVGAPVPRLRVTLPFTEEDRSDKPEFVRRSDYSLEEGKRQRAEMIRTLMSVDEMVDGIMKNSENSMNEGRLLRSSFRTTVTVSGSMACSRNHSHIVPRSKSRSSCVGRDRSRRARRATGS